MRDVFLIAIFCIIGLPINIVRAESVDSLQARAQDLLNSSKPFEAAKLHEKIVSIDISNYESNIWLGNFYFLLGQDKVSIAEKKFNPIREPNRKQTALLMDELKSIYNNYFLRAEPYIKMALSQRKNDNLTRLLESIDLFRIRVGLKTIPDNKMGK